MIEARLRTALVAAFGIEHAEADPMVRPATNARFGDAQANVAMALAKTLKKKPRDVAQRIVDHLDTDGAFEKVEVAGPGFINLTIDAALLGQFAAQMLQDPKLGVVLADRPQTIVVDYSSPNVAKEMHIGHLRSTIIGDAIARVLDFQGHRVIRQNHLGDWGTQFGMLIEYLAKADVDNLKAASIQYIVPALQARGSGAAADTVRIGDLNMFYKRAQQLFDHDVEFAEQARKRVVALQGGDEETLSWWQSITHESKQHFGDAYERLGVMLIDSDVKPESSYSDNLPGVIEQLEASGLIKESEGAAVVYPEGFTDRDGAPMPMIVRKSDGGYLYATTDLAAAQYRIDELKADRIIYVTDPRQARHFAMVFRTLRSAGWARESVRLDHVPFGTILGKDRRPFKTRTGGTVKLSDVLDEAEQRAAAVINQKNPDLPADQRDEIAHVVGIGALKYADLSNDRIKDYVFDWDRMLALEGNTAPYLQNAYVRVRSIFRKARIQGLSCGSADVAAICVTDPAERALAVKLLEWPQVIAAVADSLEPHRLCTYLYELATVLHRFYERCPVLGAAQTATRDSRLTTCALVALTLETGLRLLGIGVVEQM